MVRHSIIILSNVLDGAATMLNRLLATCILLSMILTTKYADAQIVNGGFETGTLGGWSTAGNGSVQVLTASQFAPLTPTEGIYFALVGNGPGDVGNDGIPDTGILTSDTFTVSGASLLQFDYDFLTAEFTGANSDPTRLDSFAITLQSSGNTSLVASGDVSLPTFTLIDAGNVVSAPDGTSVIEHMGSNTASVSVGLGTYSLRFQVSDAGDGSFDSALLVDNVRLTTAAATPEPGAAPLAAAAMVVVCAKLLRKRQRRKDRDGPGHFPAY
jgi:hypothetical protein